MNPSLPVVDRTEFLVKGRGRGGRWLKLLLPPRSVGKTPAPQGWDKFPTLWSPLWKSLRPSPLPFWNERRLNNLVPRGK